MCAIGGIVSNQLLNWPIFFCPAMIHDQKWNQYFLWPLNDQWSFEITSFLESRISSHVLLNLQRLLLYQNDVLITLNSPFFLLVSNTTTSIRSLTGSWVLFMRHGFFLLSLTILLMCRMSLNIHNNWYASNNNNINIVIIVYIYFM